MLGSSMVIAFIAATDPASAREFYGGKLGLPLRSDEGMALVFDAGGVMLRVSIVPSLIPAPYTVLGWEISDINAGVDHLVDQGVRFERFSGMKQDERGTTTFPDGTRVAWFKDPDGNLLSLTQFSGPDST